MKFKQKKSLLLISLIALFSLGSCSKGVIKRNRLGHKRTKQKSFDKFTAIKKKLALLSFFNEGPYGGDDIGVVATEEMRKEMARTGQFIIDPTGAKIFGNSKSIYVGGGVKLIQLARKAKVAGINFVLFGRIVDTKIREKTDEIGFIRETKSYTESKLEIRIFDVNANKEIYSDTIKGFADDSSFRLFSAQREERLTYRRKLLRYGVKVAVRRMIPRILKISKKLDWMGRVAKIIGNKIYINAGRKSGIHVSDILKVITEGTEIYDPETGALIGVSKGEIKGTVEVIDYFGPDGSIAILHSGGSVLEGDYVQLY